MSPFCFSLLASSAFSSSLQKLCVCKSDRMIKAAQLILVACFCFPTDSRTYAAAAAARAAVKSVCLCIVLSCLVNYINLSSYPTADRCSSCWRVQPSLLLPLRPSSNASVLYFFIPGRINGELAWELPTFRSVAFCSSAERKYSKQI